MSAVATGSYFFLSESQLQLILEKKKSFYSHRQTLDFGKIGFHLLTDEKSDVPWRYLKYTHIWNFSGSVRCASFPVKIQVNFSRSIIVTAGPWLVIGQRVLSLVSHWSSLSLLCSSALMMARWLCRGLEQTGTSLTSFTPDSGSTRRETSGHTKNQWFLSIRDTSKGWGEGLIHTTHSSWYSLLEPTILQNCFRIFLCHSAEGLQWCGWW